MDFSTSKHSCQHDRKGPVSVVTECTLEVCLFFHYRSCLYKMAVKSKAKSHLLGCAVDFLNNTQLQSDEQFLSCFYKLFAVKMSEMETQMFVTCVGANQNLTNQKNV